MSCPICLEVYTDPVVLPCGHSLCRGTCARKIVKKSRIACPTCRAIHWTPEGVKGLPKNYALEEIIEEKEKPEPLCPDHLDERVNLFCTQCYVPVCVKCCLSLTSGGTTLGRHRQHQVIPLDQMQSYVQGLLSVVKRYLISRQQGDYWELDRVRSIQEDPVRTRQLVIRLKLYDVLLAECGDVACLSEDEGTWAKLEEFRLILKRLDSLPDPDTDLGHTVDQPEDRATTVVNPLLELATGHTSSSDLYDKDHHGSRQETYQNNETPERGTFKSSDIDQAMNTDLRNSLAKDDETSHRAGEVLCRQISSDTDGIIYKESAHSLTNCNTIQITDNEGQTINSNTRQTINTDEANNREQEDNTKGDIDSVQEIPSQVVDNHAVQTSDETSLTEETIDADTTDSCHVTDAEATPYHTTSHINDYTGKTPAHDQNHLELHSELGTCNVDYLEDKPTCCTDRVTCYEEEEQATDNEETTAEGRTDTELASVMQQTGCGEKEQVYKFQKDIPKPPEIQAEDCTVKDTSICVLWRFPDQDSIGYFTVYYETGIFTHGLCSDLTSVVVTEFSERSGQVTLCELDPEKRYKVSVTASNDLGESLPSKYLYCRTSNTNPEKCLI